MIMIVMIIMINDEDDNIDIDDGQKGGAEKEVFRKLNIKAGPISPHHHDQDDYDSQILSSWSSGKL